MGEPLRCARKTTIATVPAGAPGLDLELDPFPLTPPSPQGEGAPSPALVALAVDYELMALPVQGAGDGLATQALQCQRKHFANHLGVALDEHRLVRLFVPGQPARQVHVRGLSGCQIVLAQLP